MEVNDELQEHAHHAKEPFDKRVAATMAIVAAVMALVSVLGHLSTTEELLGQQRASDQWAFYQAKSIRRFESEIARDFAKMVPGEASAALAEKYSASAERYTKEGEAIQEKAREEEKESKTKGQQSLRFHIGEIFLEIAIVFSSLAILTKRSLFWGAGIASATLGSVVAVTAFLIH
jgi:hypothetical protein